MLNIQGQSRALAQLQRALAAHRLAHTWVFAGPFGVGKFTAAVELARTKLCDTPRREQNAGRIRHLPESFELTLPCGTCESCRAIAAGTHPDLHIVTRELIRYHDAGGTSKGNTLSIKVIRGEIIGDPAEGKEAKIAKRSFRGRGKFFIIDEADLMEAPAQNALLKTLEEPPAESYLIMITNSPQELLQTIRSRSQIVLFAALAEPAIVPALLERGLSPEDAALVARLSHGSLGQATRWVEEMAMIDEKNAAAAKRRRGSDDEDDDDGPSTNKFSPGGVLAWSHAVADALDGIVLGRATASDLGSAVTQIAGEHAGLQLVRDKLASKDRATRLGIGLAMGLVADWAADRLRQGLGVPHETVVPAATAGLDPDQMREVITVARTAEAQADMNANVNLLVAATTNQVEAVLKS